MKILKKWNKDINLTVDPIFIVYQYYFNAVQKFSDLFYQQ